MNIFKRMFGKRYSSLSIFNGYDIADIQVQLSTIICDKENYIVKSISASQYRDDNGRLNFIVAVAYDFFPYNKKKKL